MSTPANPAAVAGAKQSPQFQAAFQVGFKTTQVDPPSPVYIAPDDSLQLSVFSNFNPATVRLMGRLLRAPLPNWNQIVKTAGQPDAPALLPPEISAIDETFGYSVGTRTLQTFAVPLAEGFLLSLGFTSNVQPGSGQYCYVVATINRPGQIQPAFPRVLFSGYVSTNTPTGWPDSQPQRPTDGAGIIRTITGSAPAAGADISEAVPFNARWTLLAFRSSLTTSATVVNRNPTFRLDDGVNIFFSAGSNLGQPANTTFNYSVTPGLQYFQDLQNNFVLPLPNLVELRNNFRIRSLTGTLQAGDQWSAPQYTVIEWQEFS